MANRAATELPLVDDHRPGCRPPRPSRRGRWRALVLLGVHLLLIAHIVHWKVTGSSLSPLEPSEAGETLTLGRVNAGFCLLVLLVASTLLLGRFFCGWGCHVVALQDGSAWLLRRLGLRPRPLRSRLLAFVPLFAAFEMFVLPSLLGMLDGEEPPRWAWHLTTEDFWARFPGLWMALLTFVVVGFGAVWMLGSKGFCTYGCPYGAIFGVADRLAPGRIRVSDACEQCGHCTTACTSNVRVHEEVARFGAVVDPGCMKCMDCVSVCPKDALSFGMGRPALRAAGKRASGRPHDLSWPEELVAAAVFLVALYAFRELYGQVPFLLAVALAVGAGACAVLLARLLRRPSFRFQDHEWKRDGRLRPAGGFALLGAGAFLALTAHSALVQYHRREADGLLAEAAASARGSEARAEALAASRLHLERTLALSLVDTAEPHNKLGQVLFELGERDAASRHLARSVELLPSNRSARVFLVDLALARGDLDAALRRLGELLDLDPSDPFARARLESLAARTGDPRVRGLLARAR